MWYCVKMNASAFDMTQSCELDCLSIKVRRQAEQIIEEAENAKQQAFVAATTMVGLAIEDASYVVTAQSTKVSEDMADDESWEQLDGDTKTTPEDDQPKEYKTRISWTKNPHLEEYNTYIRSIAVNKPSFASSVGEVIGHIACAVCPSK